MANTSNPAEIHVAGVLVHAKADRLTDVTTRISAIPGAEVITATPEGKIIVVLETTSSARIAEALTSLSGTDGVLSTSLVYEHHEAIETMQEQGNG